MNFFEAFFKPEYEYLAVIKNNGRIYSLKELKMLIVPLVQQLEKNCVENVLISSKNNFEFFINFVASIFAKKQIYILSDLKKKHILDFNYITLDSVDILSCSKCEIDYELEIPDLNNAVFTMCTSGSTGLPKMFKKNITGLFAEAQDILKEFPALSTQKMIEVVTSTTPLHMFGLTCYIGLALYNCGKIVINALEVLYPDQADLGNKIFVSTPAFLDKFRKHEIVIDKQPCLILSAGDKIKQDTLKYFAKCNINLINIYGSTETGIIAYSSVQDTEDLNCFSNVKISIDESSQLVVKSPYFIEDSMTLGDIVEIKNDNVFVLKKRNDRVLKIQEKRVDAQEIENILNVSEYVETAYCFKVEDKLACAVVLNDSAKNKLLNAEISRSELIKKLKSIVKAESQIVPQRWKFLYEIPKTQTGKIDTNKLNQTFGLNLSLPIIFNIEVIEQEGVVELAFLKDSNFFEGHFTDFPILPGVVQLYYAQYFAKYILGKDIKSLPVKKIKFSHIIKPNDKVKLYFKFNENNINYSYRIDDEIYSSGILTV